MGKSCFILRKQIYNGSLASMARIIPFFPKVFLISLSDSSVMHFVYCIGLKIILISFCEKNEKKTSLYQFLQQEQVITFGHF